MKLLFSFILVFVVANKISAQPFDVDWGELEIQHGRLIYLLPKDEGDFYALRKSGGRLLGRYLLTSHDDLKFQNSGTIRLIAENSMANFEGARIFGDKLLVFLSDKRDGNNYFYMIEYGDDLKPVGDPIKIATYAIEKNNLKGWYDVEISENGQFFSVVWEIPGKKEQRSKYGFKIFNNEMNLINEGEYPLRFDADLTEIHSHQISNAGEYFLSFSEYEAMDKKGMFGSKRKFKALHIIHIAEDGLQDFILDVEGKRVQAMAISTSEQGVLSITGIFGEVDKEGVTGVFFRRINIVTRDVLAEGYMDFDKEFIIQGWSQKAKDKADKKEEKGKGEPQLYSYEMREAIVLKDGSIVGTMEQYYVQITTMTDSRSGYSSNTYYYYYNDIITYKIGVDGEFEWLQKVDKSQVSTNDYGPYSSYESFIDNGKLYFIFNDNKLNYDSGGKFIEGQKSYTASFGRRKNVVALAEIDLETGDLKRESFFESSDVKALAVPKLFEINYDTGELLIYTIYGKKEKIGLVKFKE